MSLDGGFLHNLINELNFLVGARVDKIYQPTREELVLLMRPKAGGNKKLLISARGGAARLHITENAPENPPQAPMFCMLLRKNIGGGRLVEITQPSLERIVMLKFETRDEMGDIVYPSLIVELISARENIILTDTNGRIVDCVRRSDLEKQTRKIQPGAMYTLPEKTEKLSLFENAESAISVLKKEVTARVFEALVAKIDGVSPLVAREIAIKHCGDLDVRVADVDDDVLGKALADIKNQQQNGVPHLLTSGGVPKDFSYMPITQYGADFTDTACDGFSEMLDEFYLKRDRQARIKHSSQDISKLLNNLLSRSRRKLAARQSDLKKCENREKHRIYGELLKANIYAVNRGDSAARVVNYYDESQTMIKIPLDTALSPADNAQKYFKSYKKLCVAEKTLQQLIADTEKEIEYIESVFDLLSRAETQAELEAIRDELAMGGYIKRAGTKKRSQRSKPVVYCSPDGFRILAGRNNLQNDELTTKIADKSDIWFHTKNVHGAHIILCLDGAEPTDTALLAAAKIAAYNSKASDGSGVAVDYTPVRYVKKPNGARPGMVIYKTNKTLYVTPNENEIEEMKVQN